MLTKSPTELIGLKNIQENFLVFMIFGSFVILMGYITIDLTKELPDKYSKIIQEPLSMNTFFLLSIIGLTIISFAGLIKGEKAIHHPFVTKCVLALSRSGLSAGAIVTGMLLGIGITLWVLTIGSKQNELALNALQFISLSIFFALFIVPLIILHLYILYPWKQKILYLDLASLGYSSFVIVLFLTVDNHISLKTIGLQFVFLIMYAYLIKLFKKKSITK